MRSFIAGLALGLAVAAVVFFWHRAEAAEWKASESAAESRLQSAEARVVECLERTAP